MGYLHGVEIKEIAQGSVSITTASTSIIGIVGIATKGKVNEPVLITSLKQAEDEFGKDVNGTTIMSAVKTIFDNGGATCVVVNVGDSTKMGTVIDNATKKVKLVGGKFATQVYEKTMVSTAGFQDFTADVVRGLDILLTSESAFGIKSKIVIAPGFSQVTAVLNKMIAVSERLKAKAIIDISAASVGDAVVLRGTDYSISNSRVIMCYPNVVRYNDNESVEQAIGLSVFYAVGIAKRDNEKGYWYSPSNQELAGILKTSVSVVSSLSDELADTNLLNGKGICTLFRTYGTGFKLWGNWTSAYPTSNNLKDMIAPGRVSDIIDESIQQASLTFMDNPITSALIEYVRGSVNSFINTLKSKGAIIDGECIFDKTKNPPTELSQGHITFTYSFCPPASLDRLTFESFVDVAMLANIGK